MKAKRGVYHRCSESEDSSMTCVPVNCQVVGTYYHEEEGWKDCVKIVSIVIPS